MSGASTSHISSMDAEKSDNLPLSENWRNFNTHWKSVQVNGYKWGNIQQWEQTHSLYMEYWQERLYKERNYLTTSRKRADANGWEHHWDQMWGGRASALSARCIKRTLRDQCNGCWCSGDGGRDCVAETAIHHDPIFICQLERVRE